MLPNTECRMIADRFAKQVIAHSELNNRKIEDHEVEDMLNTWPVKRNRDRTNCMREGEKYVFSETLGCVKDGRQR